MASQKDITLPNGTTTKALVPQLYVHVREGDLQAGGALIAGNNVNLNITGNLLNGGTIAGRQVVALTADNINNLGGRILGADVGVAARTDLNNIGGTIGANNNLVASAGRDLMWLQPRAPKRMRKVVKPTSSVWLGCM